MQHSGYPSGNNAVKDRETNVGNICMCVRGVGWGWGGFLSVGVMNSFRAGQFIHMISFTRNFVIIYTLLVSLYTEILHYERNPKRRDSQNELEMTQCPQIKSNSNTRAALQF